jgi:ABC-type sugar transport system permease subunit
MSMSTVNLPAPAWNQKLARFLRKHAMGYLFIAVPVIGVMIFLIIPMFVSLGWSFTDYNGIQPSSFIGLRNYIKLFKDPVFVAALRNTTLFVLLGMSIGPTLGLLTALLLNQNVKLKSVFRTAYFMPVMTSMVVVSTVWMMLYNQDGIFNAFLRLFGIRPIHWLSDPHWALFSLVIASVWQGFGFETVVFLAALQGIPRELYDAAYVDGANQVQSFWYITLPSLRPVILFIYIIGIIGSYQVYDMVYVMTQGGPVYSTTSLVYYLLGKFQNLELGLASAVGYTLFVILVFFSFLQYYFFSEKE